MSLFTRFARQVWQRLDLVGDDPWVEPEWVWSAEEGTLVRSAPPSAWANAYRPLVPSEDQPCDRAA